MNSPHPPLATQSLCRAPCLVCLATIGDVLSFLVAEFRICICITCLVLVESSHTSRFSGTEHFGKVQDKTK